MTDRTGTRPEPRYAIQKARGKGWKTLEVSTLLDPAQARFKAMVRANPRAYFRIIQLHHKADSEFAGMEFDWKLIELYDPTAHGHQPRLRDGEGASDQGNRRPDSVKAAHGRTGNGAGNGAGGKAGRTAGQGRSQTSKSRRAGEKVATPFRLYLVVVIIGGLLGLLLAIRYNWASV